MALGPEQRVVSSRYPSQCRPDTGTASEHSDEVKSFAALIELLWGRLRARTVGAVRHRERPDGRGWGSLGSPSAAGAAVGSRVQGTGPAIAA